jgi:hypothetical protein
VVEGSLTETKLSDKRTQAMASIGGQWRTYPRTGEPRFPWDLQRLARHRAAKLGWRIHRSRKRKDPKGFMLIDGAGSTVLLGAGYTATIESILTLMERVRLQ